jgi:prepilin-type processing-associated H-X9-DG protein
MFTRFRSNYFDTRAWVTANAVTDSIERRSACYWADTYYDTGNVARRSIMNGYRVNEMAGGSGYYYVYSGLPNRGFYRRRDWKTQSEDRVGYLFENNMWTTGGVWQYVDSITTQNYSYGNYGPPVRHNNYQSTNLVFADGHAVKFPTPTFVNLAAISSTTYPVSMVFE